MLIDDLLPTVNDKICDVFLTSFMTMFAASHLYLLSPNMEVVMVKLAPYCNNINNFRYNTATFIQYFNVPNFPFDCALFNKILCLHKLRKQIYFCLPFSSAILLSIKYYFSIKTRCNIFCNKGLLFNLMPTWEI